MPVAPAVGAAAQGAVSVALPPQPPRSGRDAISIPCWSLSEWWLINELGLQLSVRKKNCLFRPCHGPNWESLVRSMYRHQIHKKTFSKIAAVFTDLSPATLLSPGNTTTNPGISFRGRERGRTNTTLLLNNFYEMKHKTQTCFTSTLTLKVSCTIWKNNNLARKYNRALCSDAWRPCNFCLYMKCLPAYLLSFYLAGTAKSK